MEEIGLRFEEGRAFVPNLLLAARAMKGCLDILKPLLKDTSETSLGTLVIGTVKGDLHDIGKNLVKMMMEGKGLNVVDLGVDVSAEQFVSAAKENNADIIACSALLTTTMTEMKNVVDAVKAESLDVKVMVGGAPVTQNFCDSIGANSYTADAASAADAALALCM